MTLRPHAFYVETVRFLRPLIMILGCLYLCGGHYGVMQVTAWTHMLVNYSKDVGLAEGARKTFNGQNPCSMCKAIQSAKNTETEKGRDPQAPTAGKIQLLSDYVPTVLADLQAPNISDAAPVSFGDPEATRALLRERPAVPPPRARA